MKNLLKILSKPIDFEKGEKSLRFMSKVFPFSLLARSSYATNAGYSYLMLILLGVGYWVDSLVLAAVIFVFYFGPHLIYIYWWSFKILDERDQELRRRNQTLTTLTHSMHHDMRNPSNSISLATYILRKELDGNKKTKDAMTILGGSSDKLKALIRGFGAWLELEENLDPEMDTFSMQALVKQIARDSQYRNRVKAKDLPKVRANRPMVMIMMDNLIRNGLRHNESTDPQVRIYQNGVGIVVEDNGVGIPEYFMDQLWDPLSRHGDKKGSGMGLAIVKRIADLNGINIEVETEAGKGTKFRLLFES